MTTLTFEQLEKYALSGKSNYWKEGYKYRWKYMYYAIEQARALGAERIIEAGSSGMPLFSDSYLMNYPEYDLNVTPYMTCIEDEIETAVKFPDKMFDCFIALQVWEHLDNQAEAFREVMRISKSAILSFPYKWKHGDKRHRNIDDKKISDWTCGIKPVNKKLIKDRLVYTWRF